MHVCVVQIVSPFGNFARIGVVAGCKFVNGAAVVRKWLLAPESTMAQLCRLLSVSVIVLSRGGVGVEQCGVDVTVFILRSLHVLFAPNRQ